MPAMEAAAYLLTSTIVGYVAVRAFLRGRYPQRGDRQ